MVPWKHVPLGAFEQLITAELRVHVTALEVPVDDEQRRRFRFV